MEEQQTAKQEDPESTPDEGSEFSSVKRKIHSRKTFVADGT